MREGRRGEHTERVKGGTFVNLKKKKTAAGNYLFKWLINCLSSESVNMLASDKDSCAIRLRL